ncbi:Metallo-dependent hydrolase [Russula emetica]|nr:Metallo-dependent hydrolase [Russula emetica]
MTSPSGIICFTNCLLPMQGGSLGVVLDFQQTFFSRKQRPERIINMGGNIVSPGFIDIQINGAYGFDFLHAYRRGLQTVAENIVETGVTSYVLLKSLYPTLLFLLRPCANPKGATFLGMAHRRPFHTTSKRGSAWPPYIYDAPLGVRIITATPQINGVLDAVHELDQRGIVFSIGHSIATSDFATEVVRHGARLIAHLFNAMPQLHHRDPSIIGLLGASPHISPLSSPTLSPPTSPASPASSASPARSSSSQVSLRTTTKAQSEAFDDHETAPQTPMLAASRVAGRIPRLGLHLEKGQEADLEFKRPFYELIVDGIHSHPNFVRVPLRYPPHPFSGYSDAVAMKILDLHLKDRVHEWRDGKRFVKEGAKLYLEGTVTVTGRCSLGEAIKCVTFDPARRLGIEDRKGKLRPGADADLVILDRSGNVLSTWVRGNEVWKKE